MVLIKGEAGTWSILKSGTSAVLVNDNFMPFLPLLELEPAKLRDLISRVEQEGSMPVKFPLEDLLVFAVQTGSAYWIEKAIICTIELEILNETLRTEFPKYLHDKRISQQVRQKIYRIFKM